MHAALHNHVSVVQALLSCSCDVNHVNKVIRISHFFALPKVCLQVTALQCKHINCYQEEQSALHLTCERGHKEATHLLVSGGADVELGDKVHISTFFLNYSKYLLLVHTCRGFVKRHADDNLDHFRLG